MHSAHACSRTHYLAKNLIKTVNILCQFYRQYFQRLSKFGWYLWKYLKINFIFYTVKFTLYDLVHSMEFHGAHIISPHNISISYKLLWYATQWHQQYNSYFYHFIIEISFGIFAISGVFSLVRVQLLRDWYVCMCVAHSHCVQNAHCWSWLVPFENERIFGICFQSVISIDAQCTHIATDPVNVWIQKRHTHFVDMHINLYYDRNFIQFSCGEWKPFISHFLILDLQ